MPLHESLPQTPGRSYGTETYVRLLERALIYGGEQEGAGRSENHPESDKKVGDVCDIFRTSN